MTSETTPFAPISRRTVASAVRDSIEDGIRSGALSPGSPLPSERELSDQFNVARTSVREAMQGLLMLGLVEKRGNRSYVAECLPEIRIDPADRRKERVAELFEVRQIFEVPIARMVCQKASEEQRKEIAHIADGFTDDMELVEFRRLDRKFHSALAMACGNATLAELFGKVLDGLFASEEFRSLLESRENRPVLTEVIRSSSEAHRQIARAILNGDEASAVLAAQGHLGDVEEQMVARMV